MQLNAQQQHGVVQAAAPPPAGSVLVSMPSDAPSHDVTDGRNARQRPATSSLSFLFVHGVVRNAAASAQALSQSSRVTRSNRSSRAAGDESDDETESTSKDRRRSSRDVATRKGAGNGIRNDKCSTARPGRPGEVRAQTLGPKIRALSC